MLDFNLTFHSHSYMVGSQQIGLGSKCRASLPLQLVLCVFLSLDKVLFLHYWWQPVCQSLQCSPRLTANNSDGLGLQLLSKNVMHSEMANPLKKDNSAGQPVSRTDAGVPTMRDVIFYTSVELPRQRDGLLATAF